MIKLVYLVYVVTNPFMYLCRYRPYAIVTPSVKKWFLYDSYYVGTNYIVSINTLCCSNSTPSLLTAFTSDRPAAGQGV